MKDIDIKSFSLPVQAT